MLEKLSEAQLDAIKEVGNIGTGNAATALSMMLDKKVENFSPSGKGDTYFEDTFSFRKS